MRVFYESYDKTTVTFEVIEPERIAWRGQHFFIYSDEVEEVYDEELGQFFESEPFHHMTHIGSGRKMFPATERLDRLIEIAEDMDTWDADWGELRQYAHMKRRALNDGMQPMKPTVKAFQERIKPYFQELFTPAYYMK